MAQLGRRLAVGGILLMAATMVLFGREVERALQARCVATAPLEAGKEALCDDVAVEPGRGCQVGVEVRLRSSSVEASGGGYAARYSFPLALAATCSDLDVRAALRWDDATRLVRDAAADASGGWARVLHVLPKFDAPSSGKLGLRATLHPDAEFGARVDSAELRVYDNVTRPVEEMVVAGIAVLVGPAVMVLGVVLGIAGWLRARRAEGGGDAAEEGTEG